MESKKFIYILKLLPRYTREANWTEETRNIVSTHFNYLKKLKEEGQLILAGRTDYSVEDRLTFGVAIFIAKDMAVAKELMNYDPAIKLGGNEWRVAPVFACAVGLFHGVAQRIHRI